MEKPILFNTEMVKAILEGRKTTTRRVVKAKSKNACGFYVTHRKSDNAFTGVYDYDENERMFESSQTPPCVVGDTLWVRETWKEYEKRVGKGESCYLAKFYGYKEDQYNPFNSSEFYDGKWSPSIHMPRKAARLFLKVTDVRCERLQDITEDGAKAEGIKGIPRSRELYPTDDYIYPFKALWDGIYAPKGYGYGNEHTYGWLENPWVWVIEFERMV